MLVHYDGRAVEVREKSLNIGKNQLVLYSVDGQNWESTPIGAVKLIQRVREARDLAPPRFERVRTQPKKRRRRWSKAYSRLASF